MARAPDHDVEDYDLDLAEHKFDNFVAERNGHNQSGGIPTADHDLSDTPWMHVQVGDDPDVDDSDIPHVDTDGLLDEFIEAFNARDLDGCLELLSEVCEMPGLAHAEAEPAEAIGDLWVRRPTCQLTRGRLDDQDAAILWEVGDNAGWWRQAVLRLGIDSNGEADEVLFDDAPDLLDRVQAATPEAQLDEGATWTEWETGDGDA